MCTQSPWTMTRSIRWRLRDWVSCFLACRFSPLDEEYPDTFSGSPSQLPIRKMVFERKDGKRSSKRILSRRSRKEATQEISKKSSGGGSDHSSWPHFEEEDYIVFCFREDGAFDVIKDVKSSDGFKEDRFDSANASPLPRPVNRKLVYGEVPDINRQCCNEKLSYSVDSYKVDEEDQSYFGQEPTSADRMRNRIKDVETSGKVSAESSDSNQSDSSAESFSFPVLHCELMGSPVQMPKSDGTLHIRKHKVHCVRFQCCRF